MTVVNEVGLGDPSFCKYIENHEDTPKMAALYALIRVLEIDPREIFYPDQDCNMMVRNGLFLLWRQCSHRANGVLPGRAISSITVSG